MTVYTSCGVRHFGGMIAFFIKSRGLLQNLPGTVGNTKAAALAAVLNDNNLTQPFFTGTWTILLIYWIFLSFLHRLNSFPLFSG